MLLVPQAPHPPLGKGPSLALPIEAERARLRRPKEYPTPPRPPPALAVHPGATHQQRRWRPPWRGSTAGGPRCPAGRPWRSTQSAGWPTSAGSRAGSSRQGRRLRGHNAQGGGSRARVTPTGYGQHGALGRSAGRSGSAVWPASQAAASASFGGRLTQRSLRHTLLAGGAGRAVDRDLAPRLQRGQAAHDADLHGREGPRAGSASSGVGKTCAAWLAIDHRWWLTIQ